MRTAKKIHSSVEFTDPTVAILRLYEDCFHACISADHSQWLFTALDSEELLQFIRFIANKGFIPDKTFSGGDWIYYKLPAHSPR